jgi:branched-chain amino acid transport system permease protein/urea transport system permease protein
MVMRKTVEAVYGRGYRNIESTLSAPIDLGGVQYPGYRLALIALAVVLMVCLALWYRRSTMGLRVRAMTGNPVLAQALGIDTRRLASQTFVIGVVLAGAAGVLLAPLVRIEPGIGVDYLLDSFFVLVVGGLGTLGGFGGGVGVIGGTQSVVSSIAGQTSGYAVVLILSILFLWLKPNGLFGRR